MIKKEVKVDGNRYSISKSVKTIKDGDAEFSIRVDELKRGYEVRVSFEAKGINGKETIDLTGSKTAEIKDSLNPAESYLRHGKRNGFPNGRKTSEKPKVDTIKIDDTKITVSGENDSTIIVVLKRDNKEYAAYAKTGRSGKNWSVSLKDFIEEVEERNTRRDRDRYRYRYDNYSYPKAFKTKDQIIKDGDKITVF